MSETTMIPCPICHKEIDKNFNICPWCGAELLLEEHYFGDTKKETPAPNPVNNQQTIQQPVQPQPQVQQPQVQPQMQQPQVQYQMQQPQQTVAVNTTTPPQYATTQVNNNPSQEYTDTTDSNFDHYYDDVLPAVVKEVSRMSTENILKIGAIVIGTVLITVYLIFML